MDYTTQLLLDQIKANGYAVSFDRTQGYVEVVAVSLGRQRQQFTSRIADGDGDEDAYRAVCELAKMIGIDREG